MYSHTGYCDWGLIKHQPPLMKNPVNGKNVKSLLLLYLDKIEIGPHLEIKSMQTQFKIMKWVVTKCTSIKLKIMDESVPSLLHCAVWSVLCSQTTLIDTSGPSWDQQKVQWLMLTTCSMSQVWLERTIPLSRYVEQEVEMFGTTGAKNQIPNYPRIQMRYWILSVKLDCPE